MKFQLDRIQQSFNDGLRQLETQVWEKLAPIVAVRQGHALDEQRIDLGIDLDEEVPDDKVEARAEEIGNVLSMAASQCAHLPATWLTRALKTSRSSEITVPAGCDPLDPHEIGQAVQRAADLLHADDVTVLHPHGAQGHFLAALTDTTPGRIGKIGVRLQPARELIDERAAAELFPDDESGKPVENGTERMLEVLRRSPFYVLAHRRGNGRKGFAYLVQSAPKLVGPKLTVHYACDLVPLEGSASAVRVARSNLVLATALPR